MGIKKIAKLANVSIGTVDRVLHKRGGVSKKTEKRILEIIEETGYQKNMMASRLKLAAVKKINFAVLIPKASKSYNYWRLPKDGIEKAVEELKELGVNVDYFEFLDSASFKTYADEIINSNYDAIVTVPFFRQSSNELLQQAKEHHIPVVFLDTEIALEGGPAHFIRQNSHVAGMVAGRLLHGLVGDVGTYFIVNILNDKGVQVNKKREEGFRKFFDTIGKKVDVLTINHPMNDTFEVTEEMENWFKNDAKKGIFVTNSRAHLIPEILSTYNVENTFLLGFDLNKKNIEYLKEDKINFLINQQPKYQGYIAIKSLFNFLTEQGNADLDHSIPVEIMVKEHFVS